MKRKTEHSNDMDAILERFLEWMRVHNYSEQTIEVREKFIGYFINWCDNRSITKPGEVTKPILERYQRHLYLHRKKNGKPLTFQSQLARLVPIRAYFKWLSRNNYILYNPAADIELPKTEKRLPKHVLTPSEVEKVLNQTAVGNPVGIRDRAIMETFYSTGMRRAELIHLKLYDLDTERGTIMIRQGKGKKDRVIPIGDRAIAWLEKYIEEVRPSFALPGDDGVLFLCQHGEAISPSWLSHMVREYIEKADIRKSGSCHLLRHSMATAMLDNGADIRFIQAMLGHEDLSTTQIYTQVSIKKLKEVHTKAHPARLVRSDSADDRDALIRYLELELKEE